MTSSSVSACWDRLHHPCRHSGSLAISSRLLLSMKLPAGAYYPPLSMPSISSSTCSLIDTTSGLCRHHTMMRISASTTRAHPFLPQGLGYYNLQTCSRLSTSGGPGGQSQGSLMASTRSYRRPSSMRRAGMGLTTWSCRPRRPVCHNRPHRSASKSSPSMAPLCTACLLAPSSSSYFGIFHTGTVASRSTHWTAASNQPGLAASHLADLPRSAGSLATEPSPHQSLNSPCCAARCWHGSHPRECLIPLVAQGHWCLIHLRLDENQLEALCYDGLLSVPLSEATQLVSLLARFWQLPTPLVTMRRHFQQFESTTCGCILLAHLTEA